LPEIQSALTQQKLLKLNSGMLILLALITLAIKSSNQNESKEMRHLVGQENVFRKEILFLQRQDLTLRTLQ